MTRHGNHRSIHVRSESDDADSLDWAVGWATRATSAPEPPRARVARGRTLLARIKARRHGGEKEKEKTSVHGSPSISGRRASPDFFSCVAACTCMMRDLRFLARSTGTDRARRTQVVRAEAGRTRRRPHTCWPLLYIFFFENLLAPTIAY